MMSNSIKTHLRKQIYQYRGGSSKNTLNTICVFLLLVVFSNGEWDWNIIPSKAPIDTDTLTVVIIEETAQRQLLPFSQLNAITSQVWKNYVVSKKGKWRVLDEDSNIDKDYDWVKEAMSLERTSLPWLVYADGNNGYSGPVPDSLEEFMGVIKR